MNNERRILEKKLRFLGQKISEIHDFYQKILEIEDLYQRSSDQISLLVDEIDRHNAQLLRIKIQEKYESIENEVD